VLASSVSLFGPILLCLVVYLRWQLGDVGAVATSGVAVRAATPLVAANDCNFVPPPSAAPSRACAAGGEPCQPDAAWMRAPGVYVDAAGSAALSGDPMSRGRWLAERIIDGAGEPRRGKRGALDVIVVGANVLGISATVRLMQAGLRVLLVDRHSWAPLDVATHGLIAARPGPFRQGMRAEHEGAPRTSGRAAPERRLRLPLVTGHHVMLVARRADGMLELQAERAGWYTANVIFASREAAAPVSVPSSGLPLPTMACAPAASRAA
jgi:hypothetical protein